MGIIKKMVADFRTSLAAKISVGGTTGSIQNNLDDDGVALPTGSYYFTLDGDNAQKEHVHATLTGSNLTDIYSVSRQGVATSGTVREHRIGASVSITDFAHILVHNNILNGDTALENKIKYSTDLTFTDDKEIVTKKYVDDIAIAGSPDATTTIKGIVLMSSAPAVSTAPTALNSEEVSNAGGTGAGESKVVRANASGYIDKDFIELGTDPGLEFVSNGLEVKVGTALTKTAGGVNVDVGTTNGKIVQMTTGDKLPAVDGSNLTGIFSASNQKVITATRTTDAVDGSVNYAHGLGTTPSWVKVTGFTDYSGSQGGVFIEGYFDGTGQKCIYNKYSASVGSDATHAIRYDDGNGTELGTISVDGTNITVAWAKSSSPASKTLQLLFVAGK